MSNECPTGGKEKNTENTGKTILLFSRFDIIIAVRECAKYNIQNAFDRRPHYNGTEVGIHYMCVYCYTQIMETLST